MAALHLFEALSHIGIDAGDILPGRVQVQGLFQGPEGLGHGPCAQLAQADVELIVVFTGQPAVEFNEQPDRRLRWIVFGNEFG